MYEVKRGALRPARTRNVNPRYPFAEMEPGDYFDIPVGDIRGKLSSRAVSVKAAAKRAGVKVDVAAVAANDNGEECYAALSGATGLSMVALRVWRKANGGKVLTTAGK